MFKEHKQKKNIEQNIFQKLVVTSTTILLTYLLHSFGSNPTEDRKKQFLAHWLPKLTIQFNIRKHKTLHLHTAYLSCFVKKKKVQQKDKVFFLCMSPQYYYVNR